MDESEWWRTFSGEEAPGWVRRLREQHQALLERKAVSQSHDVEDITDGPGAGSPDARSSPASTGESPLDVTNPEQRDGSAPDTAKAERTQLYRQFLSRTFADDPDYQTQIGALLAAFQYDISAWLVAEVVGCSVGYARRFEYQPETGVREKPWAQKQRASRVGPALRQRVLDRDESACVRCGATEEVVAHHIIPARQGGAPHMGNLATLCEDCHRAAHDGLINSGEVFYEPIEAFWRWADSAED